VSAVRSSVFVVLGPFVRWETLVAIASPQDGTGAVRAPSIVPQDGSIGFVPVYSTRAAAQKVVDRLGRPTYIVELTADGKVKR